MSFVSTGGITKLSQLQIDADKDWQTKGISNLKELVLGMINGDLVARGPGVLVRIPASVANLVLTSAGPGVLPFWAPGGLYLNRYFPATIAVSNTAVKTVPTHSSPPKTLPITRTYVDVLGDAPGSGVKLFTPAITIPHTAVKNTVRSHTKALTPSMGRKYDLQTVVEGGIRAPIAGDVDETAAAQSAAVNDMSLPPQTPLLADAYDFGHSKQFDVLRLVLGTQGAGAWTITWKYWNGAWGNLAGVTDPTVGFTAVAGTYEVTFTRPGDWALLNILGYNLWWIRAEVTAYAARVTQPLGTQAFVRIIT